MAQPTSEQAKYLNILEDMANMIKKAQTNLKKCPKQRLTEGYIKTRRKTLEDYWETFKEAHTNLMKCTPREQRGIIPYFLNEEFYTYEELYISLQGDLIDLLGNIETHQKSANMSTSSQISEAPFAKLPRIQLPTFTGRYEDWPSYQDLFLALVHNTSLNDVQKLHYLKTSVSGEAEMLLRNIQITESNYTQAWKLLKDRFGNKRMIMTTILKRLFSQKRVTNQLASPIKCLLDTTTECVNSLNNLKISTDSWDPVIVFLISQKLDTETLKHWEEHAYKENSEELPTWEEMKKFLESKFRTLELVAQPSCSNTRDKPHPHKIGNLFHVTTRDDEIIQTTHSQMKSQPSCAYCHGIHYIFHCTDFTKQPVEERKTFVKENRLCFNCLIPNHNVFKCKQTTTCRVCGRRHHSLLHQTRDPSQEEDKQSQSEQIITNAHFSREQPGHNVLLATAQVEVKSRNGNTHTLRALIDQGSEASFVDARIVELLGLEKLNISGVVSGVGEGTQIPIKHMIDLSVTSRFNRNESVRVSAYVLKTISTTLPSKHIMMNWPELQTLQLADPTYYKPGKIDILLGADIFCKIIEEGLVKMSDGVVAQKTSFGWILSGQREDKVFRNEHRAITLHVTRMIAEDNDMLRSFWEIETDVYKKKKLFTKEEEMCEAIYKNATIRDHTGRYIVHLPLKKGIDETINLCGDTKQQAINRLQQLERKFQRSEKLKEEYTRVIKEYKEMGHMMKSKSSDDQKSIYLPHHAVIRDDKDTSKVCVVYDASAKGSKNHSLNDLRCLIIKWRTHQICVIGDIVKMYRMINMSEEYTNLQSIVWRDNPNDVIESYKLTTVTFGTAAAPFLAVRTLFQLADDEAHEYPETAPVIKTSFYMDDLMVGHENIENTKKMCKEIKIILERGGFKMQKWSSNSDEVLEFLQEGVKPTNDKIDIKLDKVIKILGLTWERKDDTFKITVNLPEMRYPVTKRSVLSDIARLFDPFGWLSPVIITAKVLIQKLWLCSLEWDNELPLELREEWTNYRKELIHLQNIQIPRWLRTSPNNNILRVELHGFADASTYAYAAVTYLKVIEEDAVHVLMIASRTKVAPLEQLSIPKLELSAAALLAELMNDLIDILNISRDQVFAWTDSMVVLSWLQSQPCRWRTFVANRVADITRILDNNRWRHVQSANNPADIATRGIKACDLANNKTWWTGPEWLKEKKIEFERSEIPQTNLEVKGLFHAKLEKEENPIWERFSTISRLKRVLAYCRRFLRRNKSKESYLTANELESVLDDCVRYYQNFVYGKEIEDLKKEGRVKKRSTLITLSPFLDKKGLIRVGGRLQHASISEMSKHPIIIPIWMRTSKGRGHHATKGYICLFVCMSTRAIHLEAVTDLTSQAFIASFRRFVARRGHCLNLWSDNGTNFVGAAKELRDLFKKGKDNIAIEVAELLANDGTTWHFIPPRMPTYGGLWEAGVQSAKRHLTRVNKDTKLTYEEMATLLAQIEACLNSRPLCDLNNITGTALTPGHFLVGEPLISVPDLNYDQHKVSLLSRWQLIQKMTQDFWHRWQTEYLNTLQQRYKWHDKIPSPAVGDLVVIKEENLPPTKWLLGRIKILHPGADNLVRVVTVLTIGNHELKRPFYKLILLPKEKDYE